MGAKRVARTSVARPNPHLFSPLLLATTAALAMSSEMQVDEPKIDEGLYSRQLYVLVLSSAHETLTRSRARSYVLGHEGASLRSRPVARSF